MISFTMYSNIKKTLIFLKYVFYNKCFTLCAFSILVQNKSKLIEQLQSCSLIQYLPNAKPVPQLHIKPISSSPLAMSLIYCRSSVFFKVC